VVGNAAVMFSVAVMAPFVVMCVIGIPDVETKLRVGLDTSLHSRCFAVKTRFN
jgi:hypothetical protein